ncbi:hypothetical protein BDR05DRAFT_40507 [Suillus weaverae]|nr:hypothetical protein BDR05DRAFT_40507 [Suillus weaverae]
MADKKQQLVLSIIDFLNQSIDDGTVKQDDREGLEVAIQCIGEAFGVDPSDDMQRQRLNIKPAKLQTIFDVFLKTRDKVVSSPASTPSAPSAETKAKAEKLKQTGNTHMTVKKAAAYASKGDHASAILDSEKAIEVDPKFVKAYSRLGHAQYTLGDYKAAAAAFKKGVELDPTNANLKSGLQNAMHRIPSEDDDEDDDGDGPPPLVPEGDIPLSDTRAGPGAGAAGLGGMADMFRNMGGMGGAGGAGGMPDLASLMNNPMMMQMAQQMMANGGMERLMSNPNVANMSGGAAPSMEELMGDPELRNLASQFGAGR